MIKRQTPRVVPDRPHYITTTTDTLGEVNWRLPSPAHGALLVQLISSEGLAEKLEGVSKDKKGALASFGQDMFKLYAAQGATVGLTWFNINMDLETKRADYSNDLKGLQDYGSAVYEELYEEGWSASEVVDIWGDLFPKVVETLVDQQKGLHKANFTKAPKAKRA